MNNVSFKRGKPLKYQYVNSKKGGSLVFLLLITGTMFSLVLFMIIATNKWADKSYGDSVVSLANHSVMGEYSRELLNDYGIMAFYGRPAYIESKINKYAESSFSKHPRIKKARYSVDTSRHTLVNKRLFEAVALKRLKLEIMKGVISGKIEKDFNDKGLFKKDSSKRVLKHRGIISSLPSRQTGIADRSIFTVISELKDELSEKGSLKAFFKGKAEQSLFDYYLLNRFDSAVHTKLKHKTFFKNELEYILAGNLSDEDNERSIKRTLICLRTAINSVEILIDPKKMGKVKLLASETGGSAAPAVIAAWALAEAKNDIEILYHGGKIPWYKGELYWATSLKKIKDFDPKKGYINTGSEKGANYNMYLAMLLMLSNQTTKVYRAMDLIHINMKGNYCSEFDIKYCNRGYTLDTVVMNNRYRYELNYDKDINDELN